jgi:Cu/Ag efflux protein CusF
MPRLNDNRIRHGPRLAMVSIAVLAGFLSVLSGCGKKAADGEQRFHMKGKIVSLSPYEKTITVNHEAIPGFMGAMTMPYPVRNAKDLAGLAPGDEITADVAIESGVPFMENVTVTKKGAAAKDPAKP